MSKVKVATVRKLVKLIYKKGELQVCTQNNHFGLCSFHKGVSKQPLLSSRSVALL